jgi:hypothetical protein
VGELLEQRYSSSTHYVTTGQYGTGGMAAVLRPLEPIAAAGGWWCSGLDPLADWAPMAWGCFKPDAPRSESPGAGQRPPAVGFKPDEPRSDHRDGKQPKARKYEHPTGTDARTFWLKVPREVAERVAARFRLELPHAVLIDQDGSGGAFWRWWATEPRLPLLLTEGAKKAAALLSAGLPAVALAGIWNGAPRTGEKGADGRRTGPAELHPDLAAVPLQGRPCWVVFDHSDSPQGHKDVGKASRRLARLLLKAGAREVLVGTPPGPEKGCDDWLAAGRSWEALFQLLAPLAPLPVLPRLRRPDRIAPAGQWLGKACPIPGPESARLVGLVAAMGAGKTKAIAAAVAKALAEGRPVILIGHRVSLVSALAKELGIPFAEDAAPGSDHRLQGLALCIDSLRPGSAVRFNAAAWAGALVVIDEAAQVLHHALFSSATAIAKHRPEVLQQLQQLLSTAAQVIAADAQLSDHELQALETATGAPALLIGSEHQPAAGRQLYSYETQDDWRAQLEDHLRRRVRLWIATTAKKVGSGNAAVNLELLIGRLWHGARVLVVDSDTADDPNHDASRLAADPNGIAGAYDVVICTPAVAAGLSVDKLPGHFGAVFGYSGGHVDPEGVAQALARVRDDCPRHLFCPERSKGGSRRIGCGSTDPAELWRYVGQHLQAIAAQLAATVDLGTGTVGPWPLLWAQQAASCNRSRLAYRATVEGLLTREGYQLQAGRPIDPEGCELSAQGVNKMLNEIKDLQQQAEDEAIAGAALVSDKEGRELQDKRRLTAQQRLSLKRWQLSKRWGLDASPVDPGLLEHDRKRLSQRLRFGWLLLSPEGRQLQAAADTATARQLSRHGSSWGPDLCREVVGPRLDAAARLGLPAWLGRGDWFTADDPQLIELQANATGARLGLCQVLGTSPCKTGPATLKALLRLCGYKLESRRSRAGGESVTSYRVTQAKLPKGIKPAQLEAAWVELLTSQAGPCAPVFPNRKNGETGAQKSRQATAAAPEVQP